jgi:hypothetical protein
MFSFVRRAVLASVTALVVGAALSPGLAGASPAGRLLASGLQNSVGSTIGPDGALYVAEGDAGRVSRIDLMTGHRTTFVRGLPRRVLPLGGAMDVAFLGGTAYVLVTLVSPDVGGTDVDGIYRVDGPHRFTIIADLGAYSIAHPPSTPFFTPSGLQFALQPYRGGFLVSDGHLNRVLRVRLDGQISQLITFGDIVPTGLAVRHKTVYLAEAGPVPHLPETGKVVRFPGARSPIAETVASGAPLLVDVEFGPGGALYALSQGHFTPGHDPGSPADPDTGAVERVNDDGTMTPLATGLDRPTSIDISGSYAYITTLSGQIWQIPTS